MRTLKSPAPMAVTRLPEFAALLDGCHEEATPGALVVSRDGHTVASARQLRTGTPVPGSSDSLAVTSAGPPSADPELSAFAHRLVRLHRATVHAVLDEAVTRLGERTSEGATLLNRQLVQGSVADVALALSETQDLLALPSLTAAGLRRAHADLVRAGRTVLKLYGAYSFTREGPGPVLYVAELLGNVYLHLGSEWGDTEDGSR